MPNIGKRLEDPRAVSIVDQSVLAAAHELKSPLALIRQLSLYAEQASDEKARSESLERIRLTTERALNLVSNLTKSARLEGSWFGTETINVLSVCQEVVDEVQPLYAAYQKQLQFRPRSQPLLCVASRDLLRQILLNFADNALRYSPRSGGSMIGITHRKSRGVVRLGVRDFGPIVSANDWQSVEQSLIDRPQTLHTRPSSSGFGLVLSRYFAATMGAEIGAIRHHDGMTFYVDLPVSTQLRLV